MSAFEAVLFWVLLWVMELLFYILVPYLVGMVEFIFHLIVGIVCYFFDCDKYP
jgi:hypothetical protein